MGWDKILGKVVARNPYTSLEAPAISKINSYWNSTNNLQIAKTTGNTYQHRIKSYKQNQTTFEGMSAKASGAYSGSRDIQKSYNWAVNNSGLRIDINGLKATNAWSNYYQGMASYYQGSAARAGKMAKNEYIKGAAATRNEGQTNELAASAPKKKTFRPSKSSSSLSVGGSGSGLGIYL